MARTPSRDPPVGKRDVVNRGCATAPEAQHGQRPGHGVRGAGGEVLAQHPPALAGAVVGGGAVERGEHRLHRRVAERGVGPGRRPYARSKAASNSRSAGVEPGSGALETSTARRGRRALAARPRPRCAPPRRGARRARRGVSRAMLAATSRGGERVLARVDHGAVAARPASATFTPRRRRRAPHLGGERRRVLARPPPRRRPCACRPRGRARGACARSSPTRRANVRPPAGNQRSGSSGPSRPVKPG